MNFLKKKPEIPIATQIETLQFEHTKELTRMQTDKIAAQDEVKRLSAKVIELNKKIGSLGEEKISTFEEQLISKFKQIEGKIDSQTSVIKELTGRSTQHSEVLKAIVERADAAVKAAENEKKGVGEGDY